MYRITLIILGLNIQPLYEVKQKGYKIIIKKNNDNLKKPI